MPSKIAIVSDTSSDFPVELVKQYGVYMANAYVHFGTETFTNESITMKEFHDKVESVDDANFPKTSQATANDFTELYEKIYNEGYDAILSIHVSSKLSGTLNSANIAAGMIDGIEIHIIDTLGASYTVSACILKAIEMIKNGSNASAIAEEISNFGKNLYGFFTVVSLDNLVRGGRMSRLRYRFGNLLNIKPVLMIGNGEIVPKSKARGANKAKNKMYDIAIKDLKNSKNLKYIIAHADVKEEAFKLEKKFKKQFSNAEGFIGEIGAAISVHTGRGALFITTYQ